MIEETKEVKVLNICEMFGSVQGEGKFTGVPTIFVRTTGCNLRCVFAGGSKCDTPYSSFEPENALCKDWDSLINEFKKVSSENPKTTHICITGGEPLLQKSSLEEFLKRIFLIKDDWVVTIETNGTLPMLNPTSKDFRVALYSVSPKLSTSVDKDCKVITKEQMEHHDKTRMNYKNLFNIAMYSRDYQFKFVYSGPECISEIFDIYKQMSRFVEKGDDCETEAWMRRHPNKNTQLMPEGITNEQLNRTRKEAVDQCIKYGWRFSDREHIIIWGDKRGV